MNKTSKNEKGFSVIELLLLLIFLAIIAFIAIYVVHNKNKTVATTTTKSTTKQIDTTPANETAGAAAKRAVSIITGLQSATEGSQTTQGVSPSSYVDKNVSNGDFTSSFKTAVDNGKALNTTGQSGISCTNDFPGTFVAGNNSMNGSSATVQLEFFSGSTDETNSYSQVPQVTLEYTNGNWAVNGYACITNAYFQN